MKKTKTITLNTIALGMLYDALSDFFSENEDERKRHLQLARLEDHLGQFIDLNRNVQITVSANIERQDLPELRA